MRPMPILRVHANGVAATPGSPILDIAIWPPVILSAILAVTLAIVGAARPPRQPLPTSRLGDRRRRDGDVAAAGPAPAEPRPQLVTRSSSRSFLLAAYTSYRHTGLGLLTATMLLLIGAVALI